MLALCQICHVAFDQNQWCFLPEHLTAWLQDIKASPERIPRYNALKDVKWKRFLLQYNPQSIAFQDAHFRAAFSDMPVKHWPGEAGSLIIRNAIITSVSWDALEPETTNAMLDYHSLYMIWMRYKSPCSLQDCKLCSPHVQEEWESVDENKGDVEKEDKEERCKDDSNGMDEEKDDEKNEDEEDANTDKVVKYRKAPVGRYSKKRKTPSTARRRRKQKRRKGQERDWLTTEPYDESVPYSHRYGYTYADSTANDVIRDWRMGHGLPFEPKDPVIPTDSNHLR